MKSAYELAMERLAKESPDQQLSEDQKARIGEIDTKYKAKIAEREVFLRGLIDKANAEGNIGEVAELEAQLARETASFREKCESEKEAVRQESAD